MDWMTRTAWLLALGLLVGFSQAKEGERKKQGLTELERAAALAREAETLVIEGKITEAIEKYRKALEVQPQWTQVRFDLGRLEYEKGQIHFFNHRQQKREAAEARASGKFDDAKDKDGKAQEEFDIADPLLQASAKNLRMVIGSQTQPDNLLNAYVWLGTIHSFYEQYSEAKKFFDKASAMNPRGKAMERIRTAQRLVEEELRKREEAKEEPKPREDAPPEKGQGETRDYAPAPGFVDLPRIRR